MVSEVQPPEAIETGRLLLRRPAVEDADTIFRAYAQDPAVVRYLTWTAHESIDHTRAFLQRCVDVWEEAAAFPWVITLKPSGRIVGMIEARVDPPRCELGYVIGQEHWGQGIATEAARAVTDWALQQPSIGRVWAFVDVDNHASARVLEKVGMTREGLLHKWVVHPALGSEPRDCFVYAVWRTQPARHR